MKGGITIMNQEEQQEEGKTGLRCDQCRRPVEYGADVITVEKGVSGPRGVVPLGEALTFCSDECLASYFGGDDDLPRISYRIP
jgi:hypothetical protein